MMTRPSVDRLLLMEDASFSWLPVAPELFMRSLPAAGAPHALLAYQSCSCRHRWEQVFMLLCIRDRLVTVNVCIVLTWLPEPATRLHMHALSSGQTFRALQLACTAWEVKRHHEAPARSMRLMRE